MKYYQTLYHVKKDPTGNIILIEIKLEKLGISETSKKVKTVF